MTFDVSSLQDSQFLNANEVYQDGVVAHCQDLQGIWWAMVGHTHLGGITVWKGPDLHRMEKQYPAEYNFALGRAGEAFDGIDYPDGPRARGGVWPCGLWIDPEDGRFYCFVHNETAWGAEDTSYTAFGLAEGEPDFRHIGLMTSDDQGQSWTFVGWIITSKDPCWTERYQPDGMTGGQRGDEVSLGAGDFSLLTNVRDGFFYIFYTQSTHHLVTKAIVDRIYVARAPIASKGLPGCWRKLYNGAFTEPGNMGEETPIHVGGAIASVLYYPPLGQYLLTCYDRPSWTAGECTCMLSESDDLIHWSPLHKLIEDRPDLSKPYLTLHLPAPDSQCIDLFIESNGTDVQWATLSPRR